MKALIWMMVWKRPEVTELTYKGISRIRQELEKYGIDSEVLIISSEPSHTENAKSKGFHVFETENKPLGTKYHNGMKHALEYEWDYIFTMDSNNLVSDEYVKAWAQQAHIGTKMFGCRSFLALTKNKRWFSKFTTRKRLVWSGVGRGIKRELVENARIVCSLDINSNVDGDSLNKLCPPADRITIMQFDFPILDIKTGEDMHKHSTDLLKLERYKYDIYRKFPEILDWL